MCWVQGAGDGGDAGQAQVPVCPDGGGQESHRLLTHSYHSYLSQGFSWGKITDEEFSKPRQSQLFSV